MKLRRSVLVPIILGLVVVGCGGTDGSPGDAGGPDPADDVPAGQEPADEGLPATDDLDAMTEQIVAEVAEAEGVEPDAVRVVTSEQVTWPDGALGCPEEGGMYTQALVEGYRIVLEVDGTEHHYHGSTGQSPFRCDDPQPPVDE